MGVLLVVRLVLGLLLMVVRTQLSYPSRALGADRRSAPREPVLQQYRRPAIAVCGFLRVVGLSSSPECRLIPHATTLTCTTPLPYPLLHHHHLSLSPPSQQRNITHPVRMFQFPLHFHFTPLRPHFCPFTGKVQPQFWSLRRIEKPR